MSTEVKGALVIGASGQVGGAILEFLGTDRAVGTFRSLPIEGGMLFELEDAAAASSAASALIETAGAKVVYVAAGMTTVDRCEDEPERAMLENRDGPAAIARAAKAAGARTVYYSTEYVFDGADGPYSENCEAGPTSVYGRSKIEGERAVIDADPDALVIRTVVVYGPETHGKNFAYQLAERLSAGERMRVPSDQVSSPTYNRDLAEASVRLVEAGASGVFHITGSEVLDRASFARRLALALGLDGGLIDPVPTAELGQKASRPLNAGLRIDKLLKALPGFEPRTVEDAVAHWLENQRGKKWPS